MVIGYLVEFLCDGVNRLFDYLWVMLEFEEVVLFYLL